MTETPTPPPVTGPDDYGAAEPNGQEFDAVAEFTVPVEPPALANSPLNSSRAAANITAKASGRSVLIICILTLIKLVSG